MGSFSGSNGDWGLWTEKELSEQASHGVCGVTGPDCGLERLASQVADI